MLEFDPEVVIFGSGPELKFVSPALYRNLIAARIGVETMDSGAACRTYTVLVAEGRRWSRRPAVAPRLSRAVRSTRRREAGGARVSLYNRWLRRRCHSGSPGYATPPDRPTARPRPS